MSYNKFITNINDMSLFYDIEAFEHHCLDLQDLLNGNIQVVSLFIYWNPSIKKGFLWPTVWFSLSIFKYRDGRINVSFFLLSVFKKTVDSLVSSKGNELDSLLIGTRASCTHIQCPAIHRADNPHSYRDYSIRGSFPLLDVLFKLKMFSTLYLLKNSSLWLLG